MLLKIVLVIWALIISIHLLNNLSRGYDYSEPFKGVVEILIEGTPFLACLGIIIVANGIASLYLLIDFIINF